jgi:hypothetical protein
MAERAISEDVREYVRREYIQPARRRGDLTVRIVAGEVHKALRLTNRVPTVCDALASGKFLEQNNLAIEHREGPPSGRSTTVTFVYRLKPEGRAEAPEDKRTPFLRLRGIAKDLFQSLGGGEAFIQRERERFYNKPRH